MAEYISRDKVLSYVYATHSTGGFKSEEDYLWLQEAVVDSAVADVQPVKRGHWIEVTPRHSKCSICDTTCLIAVYPISKNANYCPNCGARMDGEQNDD